ncbi:hypothetical protein [Streptomyces cyaneofuscatus]
MAGDRPALWIEGKRYDTADREDFHRDLRADYIATLRNGAKTRGLLEEHVHCDECLEVRAVFHGR